MSMAFASAAWPWGDEDYAPVSESSSAIQRARQMERNPLRSSASDWLPAIEGALRDIRIHCQQADWDPEGAAPITDLTIELAGTIAALLFDALPKGTPTPDFTPESDGEICMSWSLDEKRIFSLSVGDHGKINFAGQFGDSGGVHAWQRLDTTSQYVLQNSLAEVTRSIQRLYAAATWRRAA